MYGNYPMTDFRTSGLVHPAQKPWRRDLTLYILKHFSEDLQRLRLHEVIMATCYGIEVSKPTFYAIFELYCPASGTFFTPVSELELALHEMWEVLNLLMGSIPYEKYFPCTVGLKHLEKQDPTQFKMHNKLMCHFYISTSTVSEGMWMGWRVGLTIYFLLWKVPLMKFSFQWPRRYRQDMAFSGHGDVLVEDDEIDETGDEFKRFHHQASQPMSQKPF